jgi:hypothetical protein
MVTIAGILLLIATIWYLRHAKQAGELSRDRMTIAQRLYTSEASALAVVVGLSLAVSMIVWGVTQ